MHSATRKLDLRAERALSGVRAACGIDIGATFTRVAIVDTHLNVPAQRRFVTEHARDASALMAQIAKTANLVGKLAGIEGAGSIPVGLAVAGTLDEERQVLMRSVNLPLLEGMRIGRMLSARMKLTPLLITDAEATTWGEYICRVFPRSVTSEGREPPSRGQSIVDGSTFVHLRIGTGVACGVVRDGQLLRLDAGRVQHLEELVVDDSPDATQCPCGRRGCLETVASGAALTPRVEARGIAHSIEGLQRACELGDTRARDLIRETAESMRKAVRNVAQRWNADVVCVGGGVVENLPALLEELRRLDYEQRSLASHSSSPSLELSQLGDSAGAIGAALVAAQGT